MPRRNKPLQQVNTFTFAGQLLARDLWGIMLWRRDGHAGRGGFPHESNLRWGEGVGLVNAEGAVVSGCFLPRRRITSLGVLRGLRNPCRLPL